jgi:CRP-like cAMP-binding protein
MSVRLQVFPGFAAWSEAELLALERHLTLQQVKPGHVFIHEGRAEPAELALFALVKGQVVVARQDARFTLDEGALFGVVAFVDGGARSATVQAATDVEVLVLSRAAHQALEPALAARL